MSKAKLILIKAEIKDLGWDLNQGLGAYVLKRSIDAMDILNKEELVDLINDLVELHGPEYNWS